MSTIAYICSDPHLNLNPQNKISVRPRELIFHLKNLGRKVGVFFPQIFQAPEAPENHPLEDILKAWMPSVIMEPLKKFQQRAQALAFEKSLLASLEVFQPAFIYERLENTGPVALTYAKENKIPYFVEIHRSLSMAYSLYETEQAMKMAAGIVCVSVELKNQVAAVTGSAQNIHVIPHGIDLTVFNPSGIHQPKASRWIGCQPRPYIGITRTAYPYRGVSMLLEIFAEIKTEKEVTLAIEGTSQHDRVLQEEAERLGLSRFIAWTGAVAYQEIPELVSQLDIAVVPYACEDVCPVEIFEYGAMGCAIIAPKTKAVTEILTHQNTALLFEPHNKTQLKEALRSLIQDTDLRKTLAQNFQSQVLQTCGWNHRAIALSSLIASN